MKAEWKPNKHHFVRFYLPLSVVKVPFEGLKIIDAKKRSVAWGLGKVKAEFFKTAIERELKRRFGNED